MHRSLHHSLALCLRCICSASKMFELRAKELTDQWLFEVRYSFCGQKRFQCCKIIAPAEAVKVIKGTKIGNRYNQVPYLTQDNTWESDKYIIEP